MQITHDAAWSVGTQYNVGTIASGYRPAVNTSGIIGTFGVGLALVDGRVYMRPLYATELTAGASSYVRFVYLLP